MSSLVLLIWACLVTFTFAGDLKCYGDPRCSSCACRECLTSRFVNCDTPQPSGSYTGDCIRTQAGPYNDLTGTPADDCFWIGSGTTVTGDIDMLQGRDCVVIENDAVVQGSIDMGDGDDCLLSDGNLMGVDLGEGNDIIQFYESSADDVDGGNGDDCMLFLKSTAQTVQGSGGNDCMTFVQSRVNSEVDADSGDDVLEFSASVVGDIDALGGVVKCGEDDDYLYADLGSELGDVELEQGNDYFLGQDIIVKSIDGMDGDDTIHATNLVFDENVDGGDGNDNIQIINGVGQSGANIEGGDDNDIVSASKSLVDVVDGNDGDDTVVFVYPRIFLPNDQPMLNGGGGANVCVFNDNLITASDCPDGLLGSCLSAIPM